MDLSYILHELGEDREHYANAVVPPIYQTSNFKFNTVAEFRSALAAEFETYLYTRGNNPTINILRKKLAALDQAEDALVFASGVAASTIPILALLAQGDEVICVENPYSWMSRFFKNVLPRFGVNTTFVPADASAEVFEQYINPNTKLIYLESPNTFSFELQDLKAIAQLAKKRRIYTLVDNSYCSPLYQQPHQYGIDLVMQSATKYLAGHSDVVAGVLSGSSTLIKKIFESEYMNIGAILSPQNAWLMIRSLRTLPLRLEQSSKTCALIVEYLYQHPAVAEVLYPFHHSFKQFKLAKRQMQGCGGLFSFRLKNTNPDKIELFCNRLQRFSMAVSWGGHESLVMPAIAGITKEQFDPTKLRHQLIRVYVGLEEANYLIQDLEQALDGL